MNKISSFSLSDEAVQILEQIPKGERSNFVADAIIDLAYEQCVIAMNEIKGFSRFDTSDKLSIVKTLREIRTKAK